MIKYSVKKMEVIKNDYVFCQEGGGKMKSGYVFCEEERK